MRLRVGGHKPLLRGAHLMPQLTYNGRYIMSDSGNRSKHRWKKLCITPRLEIGLGALGRSCHARSKSGDRADMHVAVVDQPAFAGVGIAAAG
jgi:hypothetical protein